MCPQRQKMKIYVPHVDAKNGGSFSDVTHDSRGKSFLVFPQMHGKRILKLLQKIFSWLPLATVIDQKVLVLHGGISDVTDLSLLARLDRHNVRIDIN